MKSTSELLTTMTLPQGFLTDSPLPPSIRGIQEEERQELFIETPTLFELFADRFPASRSCLTELKIYLEDHNKELRDIVDRFAAALQATVEGSTSSVFQYELEDVSREYSVSGLPGWVGLGTIDSHAFWHSWYTLQSEVITPLLKKLPHRAKTYPFREQAMNWQPVFAARLHWIRTYPLPIIAAFQIIVWVASLQVFAIKWLFSGELEKDLYTGRPLVNQLVDEERLEEIGVQLPDVLEFYFHEEGYSDREIASKMFGFRRSTENAIKERRSRLINQLRNMKRLERWGEQMMK